MNAPHLHLLINHLPILASGFAVPILLLAVVRKADPGFLGSGALLLVIAGLAAPVAMVSGKSTEHEVKTLADVLTPEIEDHESRAAIAAPASLVSGVLGAIALVMVLRRRTPTVMLAAVVLLGAVVTSGLMAWTGASGGRIRHSEIRVPAD